MPADAGQTRSDKIAIVTDIEMNDDLRSRAFRGITNSRHIDHNARFVTADGVAHDLAKIHLTVTPHPQAGDYQAHQWKSAEMPVDPYIAIESDDGKVFPLADCKCEIESKHALGFFLRPEEDEYWLLSASNEAGSHDLSLEDLREGHFDVIRIYGQSEECVAMIGPVSDIEIGMIAEGEFDYSDEEKPVLTGSGWWSNMGRNSPDKSFDREVDEQKADAIMALIERERSPSVSVEP